MVVKANILIVDDNVNLFKTMSFVLKHKGYDVSTAISGLEAIELIKQKSFDIIFLDIKMPTMNGVEAFKKIKRISPKTTVILMTAYAVEDLIQEALREGVHGVLYKPMNMDKLQEIINKYMKKEVYGLILLVDDNPDFNKTLKNILIKRNFKVNTAETGDQAIVLAKKNNYDIIFIDMILPTINGLETYLAIKEFNPKVIAIMVTAFHQEMDSLLKEALDKDAYACLKKPLDMAKMLRLVEEIWAKKQKDEK